MKISKSDINKYEIRKQADKWNLDYDTMFAYASDFVIKKCYNGVGNQALPNFVREILTRLTSFFTDIPFMIHDFDYQYLNKTEYNFHKSNKRLRENLKKILNEKLTLEKNKPKWWEIWKKRRRAKRLFYLNMIRIIYFAVEEFGWGAFKNGGIIDD